MTTNPPQKMSVRARVISILVLVVVLGGFGAWIGSSYVPMGTATDCLLTDIQEENGRGTNKVTRYVTSCGEYYTDHGRGMEIGESYDLELRGVFKTNIIAFTAT